MQAILITGVSTGIGYATAKEFIQQGYQVFGSVRKDSDAKQLMTELGDRFCPLVFDITDSAALKHAAEQVALMLEGRGLVGLINNAGVATSGPLIYQPLDEIRWQFEVNVVAQVAVIQAFFPLLKESRVLTGKASKIINISSFGGKIAMPFLGSYAGSKHAFEGLSDSLRRELQLHGIDVVVIGPGGVNTPMWDKESAQDMSPYDHTEFSVALRAFQRYFLKLGKAGFSPERMGRLIRKVFELKHPRARYAAVANPIFNWIIPRIVPPRWVDKFIGKQVGLL
jgi:short-subunit dehydrogenase